ncbi:ComEC/Rec2 family competence protein [Candidatus Nomurabacteria bacterium]|nr:ComEC/Rec2 family competence protein [Candidatus Nomurabacteria bacterium]
MKLHQSKSKTFFAFCFSFLLGIVVFEIFEGYFSHDSFGILILILALCFSIFLFAWKQRVVRFALLCVGFAIFGMFRSGFALPSQKSIASADGQKTTFIGYVASEPDVRIDGVRYIVKIDQTQQYRGKVYFKNNLYPRYQYGDVLQMSCSVKKPEPIENFRYDKYLKNFNVEALCTHPGVTKIGTGRGNPIMRSILHTKNIVAQKINIFWHEPYASFVAGLLYGYRGGLGQLSEEFNRTGVTHIVAISGYNITIVSSFFMILLMHLYVPRKRAFFIAVFGIIVFTLFAGASASVVRAAIMGILVLTARQMGRLSSPANALILCAALMCVHNPNVLLWDAGFQLSFLATIGLVYMNPVLESRCSKVPEVLGIRESLISTLSATIITLPLILFQFERLSVVSVVVNMLVLPMVPVVMYLGFATVLIAFFSYHAALLLSWITWLCMQYIVQIVHFFGQLPFASIDISIPFWLVLVSYAVMFGMIYKTSKPKTYQL